MEKVYFRLEDGLSDRERIIILNSAPNIVGGKGSIEDFYATYPWINEDVLNYGLISTAAQDAINAKTIMYIGEF